MSDEKDPVEEIEARRAARKAGLAQAKRSQLAVDLEALDAAEIEQGDSNVGRIDVPFTPGLPTFAAVRAAKKVEVKRYRDSIRPKNGEMPDLVKPTEDVGAVARVYPPKTPEGDALFEKMCEARPTLLVTMGTVAIDLASGKAAAEGKG